MVETVCPHHKYLVVASFLFDAGYLVWHYGYLRWYSVVAKGRQDIVPTCLFAIHTCCRNHLIIMIKFASIKRHQWAPKTYIKIYCHRRELEGKALPLSQYRQAQRYP